MTALYSQKDLHNIGKRLQKYVIICLSLVFIALAVGVTVCFFANETNLDGLKLFNIVFSSVCCCIALYLLLNKILPICAKKIFVSQVLSATTKTIRGKVSVSEKKITLSKYLSFFEVRLVDASGRENLLYFDSSVAMPSFDERLVALEIVNNKIVGYGEVL